MIRLIVFILFVSSVIIFFIPNEAFGCVVAPHPLKVFSIYDVNYSSDCTKTIGNLTLLGLMLIMLIVSAEIIIIKNWLKFSRKFYLLIIPAVFFCLLAYSVAFYGSIDLTEFFIAHGIIGDTSSTYYALQLATEDFTNMLEEHNVKYRSENMYVSFDTYKLTQQQYQNRDYPFPYEYCGIAIADDHTEYWYSASYDNKKITESQFHEDFPQKPCGSMSKTCICKVTKQVRDQFKFRP